MLRESWKVVVQESFSKEINIDSFFLERWEPLELVPRLLSLSLLLPHLFDSVFGFSLFLFQINPQAHFRVAVTRIHSLPIHRHSVSYLTYISINYLQQGY